MTEQRDEPPAQPGDTSRLRLVWDAVVFQLKLAVDGTRDLVLIPISLAATLWGLVFGGSEPDRYFKRVLAWGQRSESWINLFGHHTEGETSDQLLQPFQQRVFDEVERNPALQKATSNLNRALDQVNSTLKTSDPTPPSENSSDHPKKEP